MKLDKQFIFKALLLMMLSLKVSFVVYQNISQLSNTEKTSCLIDADEPEKLEKKELDISEKIQQKLTPSITFSALKNINQHSHVLLNYKTFYLEYTTPPPEII